MKDKKYIEIKERLLQQTMALWGIEQRSRMDPVVDLMLDVFAYEIFRLHQEIKNSDARILHRLSRLLTHTKWYLPNPAHTLMSVNPLPGETCELTPEDHFYTEKPFFGNDTVQLFFTPLTRHTLVHAYLKYWVYDVTIARIPDQRIVTSTIFDKKNKIKDYNVWVGIAISDKQLKSLKTLTLCFLLGDASLLPFLNMVKVFDAKGNELQRLDTDFSASNMDENHYFEDISSYYKDFFYTIDLHNATQDKATITDTFSKANIQDDDIDSSEHLFWIQLSFPEVFDKEQLNALQFYINTYPVVNRQLIYKQHHCKTNGKIIPIANTKHTHFLNIHSVYDDQGEAYKNITKHYEKDVAGTFSLYFGDLERFNADTAKTLITKVLQLIREDGNAFAAMNPDALNSHLKEMTTKLDELEKIVESVIQDTVQERIFLLTSPKNTTSHQEVRYWLTNGELANGLDERAFIQQFNAEKFDTLSIKFRTETQGARVRKNEEELINSLRYGLLTKDRIVSREDIKSFIKQQLGGYIQNLNIKDGVAILPEYKRGVARTTEVVITLMPNIHIQQKNLAVLAHYLEKQLSEKSISNSFYKILFQ